MEKYSLLWESNCKFNSTIINNEELKFHGKINSNILKPGQNVYFKIQLEGNNVKNIMEIIIKLIRYTDIDDGINVKRYSKMISQKKFNCRDIIKGLAKEYENHVEFTLSFALSTYLRSLTSERMNNSLFDIKHELKIIFLGNYSKKFWEGRK